MRDLFILLIHVLVTLMRVVRPGGVRAVVAESVLAQHQLLIFNRSRRRAPNLRILDRLVAGLCSLWIRPRRLRQVAIAFKTSTFLGFHRAMVQYKYRWLFSPRQKRKPGPKGPTAELTRAVVEMKSEIRVGDVRKLPTKSTWLSGHLLIRMSPDSCRSLSAGAGFRWPVMVDFPGTCKGQLMVARLIPL